MCCHFVKTKTHTQKMVLLTHQEKLLFFSLNLFKIYTHKNVPEFNQQLVTKIMPVPNQKLLTNWQHRKKASKILKSNNVLKLNSQEVNYSIYKVSNVFDTQICSFWLFLFFNAFLSLLDKASSGITKTITQQIQNCRRIGTFYVSK